MSKLISFSFVFLFSVFSFAGTDCSIKAESYVVDAGLTQPARYIGKTREGDLIYYVRANYHGGDSEYEVVLDTNCDYRSLRLLWSE